MDAQDSEAMLGAMRELPVAAGDAVFVPAGAPHAIGAGILMVEVQEPTDLSVLLEWDGFELTEDEGHLDLGWDTALQALDRSAWSEARVGRPARPGPGPLAAPARAPTPGSGPSGSAAATSSTPASRILVGLAGDGEPRRRAVRARHGAAGALCGRAR